METATLQTLERVHPEWSSWLGVIGAVMRQIEAGAGDGHSYDWSTCTPRPSVRTAEGVPMLGGASVDCAEPVAALFDELRVTASRSGAPGLAGLAALRLSARQAVDTFMASIDGDDRKLAQLAEEAGVGRDGFIAVAGLLPLPFLHACRRAWATSLPVGWTRGYCPVCGAWPSLAEACGVERRRYLRCGRCGTGWQMPRLTCPYCENEDHAQLALMMDEEEASGRSIEACRRCRGYVKAFTALMLGPGPQVMLRDMASIDLDIVATSRDFRRPAGPGCMPGVRIAGLPVASGRA